AQIGARRVGRQIAAPVGPADRQAGEFVEGAVEDQVRERDGRLQRVADDVAQQPVALEPLRDLGGDARALRMDEDEHAELLGLGPERIELRIADLLAVDAAADAGAAQPVLLHAVLELLGGQIGILQRHRREGDEAVGMGGAGLSPRPRGGAAARGRARRPGDRSRRTRGRPARPWSSRGTPCAWSWWVLLFDGAGYHAGSWDASCGPSPSWPRSPSAGRPPASPARRPLRANPGG